MATYEISDDLVTLARGWLRIGITTRDDEIRQTMKACLIDLHNGGVENTDTEDAAIQQAMKLYLKAQFGYDEDAERFGKAYEFFKWSLELSGDYNGKTAAEETSG